MALILVPPATSTNIGLRVMQASRGEYGTIVDTNSHGRFVVIYDDGSMSLSQEFESRSPLTRIVPIEEPRRTAEQIAELRAKREQYIIDQRIAREQAAIRHKEEFEIHVAQIREAYPNAETKGSSHARGAKNIKKELTFRFPGIKFEVKSKSYSGGNSISIYWTDGPTGEQVSAYTNKYQSGDFDGMTDCYNHDSSPYNEAVQLVLGGAMYVFTQRRPSDPVSESCRAAIIRNFELPEGSNDSTYIKKVDCYVGTFAHRCMYRVEIPAGKMVSRIGIKDHEFVAIFA